MSEPAPWYASTSFVASAIFLALVAIGAGFLAIVSGDDGARTASAPVKRAGAVPTGGSVCGLPVGSTDPVLGPPDAEWRLVGNIAAPSIRDVGPGLVEAHDRRCYAHSPLGALLAAANMLPVITPPYAVDARKLIDHFAPGHVRDVYARQPAAPVDPNARVQLAGFRMQVLSPDAVDVTTAYRTNVNGIVVSAVWSMRWVSGDWRAQLHSLQQPLVLDAPVTLDETWIRWGGA